MASSSQTNPSTLSLEMDRAKNLLGYEGDLADLPDEVNSLGPGWKKLTPNDKAALGEAVGGVMQPDARTTGRIIECFIAGCQTALGRTECPHGAQVAVGDSFSRAAQDGTLGVTMTGGLIVEIEVLRRIRRDVSKIPGCRLRFDVWWGIFYEAFKEVTRFARSVGFTRSSVKILVFCEMYQEIPVVGICNPEGTIETIYLTMSKVMLTGIDNPFTKTVVQLLTLLHVGTKRIFSCDHLSTKAGWDVRQTRRKVEYEGSISSDSIETDLDRSQIMSGTMQALQEFTAKTGPIARTSPRDDDSEAIDSSREQKNVLMDDQPQPSVVATHELGGQQVKEVSDIAEADGDKVDDKSRDSARDIAGDSAGDTITGVTSTPMVPDSTEDGKSRVAKLFDPKQSYIPKEFQDVRSTENNGSLMDDSYGFDETGESDEEENQTQIPAQEPPKGEMSEERDPLDVTDWVNWKTVPYKLETLLATIPSEKDRDRLSRLVPVRGAEAAEILVQIGMDYAGRVANSLQYQQEPDPKEREEQLHQVLTKVFVQLSTDTWSQDERQDFYNYVYRYVMTEFGLFKPFVKAHHNEEVSDEEDETDVKDPLTVTSLDVDNQVSVSEQIEGGGQDTASARVAPTESPTRATQHKKASSEVPKEPEPSRTQREHNEKYQQPKGSGKPDLRTSQGAKPAQFDQLGFLRNLMETQEGNLLDTSMNSNCSSILRGELADHDVMIKNLQSTVARQELKMTKTVQAVQDQASATILRMQQMMDDHKTQYQRDLKSVKAQAKAELEKEARQVEHWSNRASCLEKELERNDGEYRRQLKLLHDEQQDLKYAISLQQAYDRDARRKAMQVPVPVKPQFPPVAQVEKKQKEDTQPPLRVPEVPPEQKRDFIPFQRPTMGGAGDREAIRRPDAYRGTYREKSPARRSPERGNEYNKAGIAAKNGGSEGEAQKDSPLTAAERKRIDDFLATFRLRSSSLEDNQNNNGQQGEFSIDENDHRLRNVENALMRTVDIMNRLASPPAHTLRTQSMYGAEKSIETDPAKRNGEEYDELGNYIGSVDERAWMKRKYKELNYTWGRIDQLPKFYGDKKEGIRWERWQQLFLSECKVLDVDEVTRLRILGDKLNHGEAADTLCRVKDMCANRDKKYTSELILKEFTAKYFDTAARLRLKKELHSREQENQCLYEYANDMYEICRRLFADNYLKACEEWHEAMERGVKSRRDWNEFFKKAASQEPDDILEELRDLGEHLETKKHPTVTDITACTMYTGNQESEQSSVQRNREFCNDAMTEDIEMEERMLIVDSLQGIYSSWGELGRNLVPDKEPDPLTVVDIMMASKPRRYRQTPDWIRDLKGAVSKIVTSKILDVHKTHPIPMLERWNSPEFKEFRSWLVKHIHVMINSLEMGINRLVTPDAPLQKAGGQSVSQRGKDKTRGRGRGRGKFRERGGGDESDPPKQASQRGGRGGYQGPPRGRVDVQLPKGDKGDKLFCQMCGHEGHTYGLMCAKGKAHLCGYCARTPQYRELLKGPQDYCVFCAHGINEYGHIETIIANAVKEKHFPK